jgi:hypothetical protein
MVRDKLEERGRWEDSGSAKRVRDGRCSATQTQDSTVQSHVNLEDETGHSH